MRLDVVLTALVALVALPVHSARAQIARELSTGQLAEIDSGRQVFLTWDVASSPWPRACVFQRVDAPPEEAAAAFTNFARHRRYIPGLRRSEISRVVDPVTTEVDYTLDLPLVADEDYTVRDRLGSYDGGASYRVAWTLVRASSTKATEGSVRFEPRGSGTLMAYCNLVTPGSRLARLSFIRSRALAQIRAAAAAIAAEVTRQRVTDRALLDAEVAALRGALAGHAPDS